jgi:phage baseplate assembly protein W
MSFPFRLDATGAIATVEQGSDTWVEECIAIAMLTRPGERDQVPSFGVADPAFAAFQVGLLQRHLVDFGPRVTITKVDVTEQAEGRERITVTWQQDTSGIVAVAS